MAKFKDKLIRFASGRYGTDALYYVISGVALIVMVVYIFVQKWWLYPIILLLLGWGLFRCFSRNIYRRRKENAVLLKVWRAVKGFFKLNFDRVRFCRSKVFRKCPHCKAVLRLPRARGRHVVRCPRCGQSFEVRVALGKKK